MKRTLLIIVCLGLWPLQMAQAYNFLYIHPTEGRPIGWEPGTTIQYYLDPGKLGRLTNDQAHTLLKEAMKIWENASPYANVPHFEFAGYLPEDVDETNYQKYVSLFTCYTDDLESCPSEAQKNLQTVVVFDDGTILNEELCKITGCSAIAGARVFSGSTQDPEHIVQGIFVLSALSIGEANETVGVMVHELGHLLGFAHTYLNQQSFDQPALLPTMELLAATPLTLPNEAAATLHPDDVAGISTLYPSEDFSEQTATIKGQVLKSDGSPMMHVNVIARNVEDPLCEAYSWLSGRVCPEGMHATTINSSFCVDDASGEVPFIGNFLISGLPPGSYTLEVEEVADEDLAWTLAPGLVDPFIYGDAEFWNEGDQADESNAASSVITLAAGETREGIDITMNRSMVTEDRIKYLPLSTFTLGPGTSCPEASPIDYGALIGETTTDDPDTPPQNTGETGNNSGKEDNGTGSSTTSPISASPGCSLIP